MKHLDTHDTTDSSSPLPRTLDDSELDSGDDASRHDRARADDDIQANDDGTLEELNVLDRELGPHPVPEPGDGEASNEQQATTCDANHFSCIALFAQSTQISRHRARCFPRRHVPAAYDRLALEEGGIVNIFRVQDSDEDN